MNTKHLFLFIILALVFNLKAQQNVYKHQLGDYTIYLLSERQGEGSSNILIDASDEMLKSCVPNGKFSNAMNCFLLETKESLFLFDTGVSGANLLDNLKKLEKNVDEISAIFITHLHGDHFGGLLIDGQKSFPEANLYLSQNEYDYFMSEEARGGENVRQILEIYKENVVLFEPGTFENPFEAKKGINCIAAYGHTPGHTCYLIENKDDKIFIWGDLTHAMAIQMPFPKVAVTYDVCYNTAVKTRLEFLDFLQSKNIPIAGMHIAFPGMGFLKINPENGYDFEPIKIVQGRIRTR